MRACAAAATSALHCMPATERAAAARWDHVRLLLCWPGALDLRTSLWAPTIYIYRSMVLVCCMEYVLHVHGKNCAQNYVCENSTGS